MENPIETLLRHERFKDAERIAYITGDPRHSIIAVTEDSGELLDDYDNSQSYRDGEIDDLEDELADVRRGIRKVIGCLENQVDDDRESLLNQLQALT